LEEKTVQRTIEELTAAVGEKPESDPKFCG
jgi:hypothetical protein